MSFLKRHLTLLTVAVGCLGLGAGASAIATAGAAGTSPAAAKPAARAAAARALWRRIPGVHDQLVVHTKNGFKTVTIDRGTVVAVSGERLTLREGTAKATYQTETLTIPADARVRNHGRAATLGSLRAGERAVVLQGLKRTLVIAHTPRG